MSPQTVDCANGNEQNRGKKKRGYDLCVGNFACGHFIPDNCYCLEGSAQGRWEWHARVRSIRHLIPASFAYCARRCSLCGIEMEQLISWEWNHRVESEHLIPISAEIVFLLRIFSSYTHADMVQTFAFEIRMNAFVRCIFPYFHFPSLQAEATRKTTCIQMMWRMRSLLLAKWVTETVFSRTLHAHEQSRNLGKWPLSEERVNGKLVTSETMR